MKYYMGSEKFSLRWRDLRLEGGKGGNQGDNLGKDHFWRRNQLEQARRSLEIFVDKLREWSEDEFLEIRWLFRVKVEGFGRLYRAFSTMAICNYNHTIMGSLWSCLSKGVVLIQSLSHVWLCDPMNCSTPASLSITNSWGLLKLMSIESVMPSNHLILYHPLLLLPSIFPSIRVFSNESVLCIRWPKYWNFSFSISPSNKYSELIFFRIDWFDLLAVHQTLKSEN